jgi:transcriptional regulator GlxA family with amidase domain
MSKTEQKMPSRNVVIFAYDGAQFIDIAGPTQALTTANEEGALPAYTVQLVAVSGGPIRTASGVKLIAGPLPRVIAIDTLLCPWRSRSSRVSKRSEGFGCAAASLHAFETHLRGLHRSVRIG